jgi:hypothetical protein
MKSKKVRSLECENKMLRKMQPVALEGEAVTSFILAMELSMLKQQLAETSVVSPCYPCGKKGNCAPPCSGCKKMGDYAPPCKNFKKCGEWLSWAVDNEWPGGR